LHQILHLKEEEGHCTSVGMQNTCKEEDVVVDDNNYYDNYAQCIRESIRLGGCTASRSIYVGSICARYEITSYHHPE
jgi:hypothetical protein